MIWLPATFKLCIYLFLAILGPRYCMSFPEDISCEHTLVLHMTAPQITKLFLVFLPLIVPDGKDT